MTVGSSPSVILVTDASMGSAIAIIRSLGRRGHRVIAADSDPRSLGFRSRYAARSEVYPSPKHEPDAFCESVRKAVREHRVDLVIPATDWTLRPLAAARTSFDGLTRLAIAEDDALAVTTSKEQTLRLARKVGVPVPETRLVHTVAEAVCEAPALGWPLVLKPKSSHRLRRGEGMDKFQVAYAASEADLREKMARLEGRCAVLLQRYLQGAGCGVSLLLSRGRPLAAFGHRRLREIPVTGGASSYRESVSLDRELYAHAARMLGELQWTGLAMVEFKVGGGRSELMEVNGRVWGSLPLAVASGVDFPALLARLHLEGEETIEPRIGEYRVGVRCRNLETDVLWIAQTLVQWSRHPFLKVPGRLEAVPAVLGMFDPRNKMDVQCWDDPIPGLVQLPRILRKLLRKARSAMRTPETSRVEAV